ncbi:MAG: NFACT family protein, partial [bacterium]
MQLDSLALARLVDAGRPLLVGATVRDCQIAPDGQGLLMGLAGPSGFRTLRFSVQRRYSRWHLAGKLPSRVEALENHVSTVARQKLLGATLTALTVEPGERILVCDFVRRDFTGEEEQARLIAELMGPASNLLILDHDGIIDATWKIAHSYENTFREVRPGKPYHPPPPAGRYPMRVLGIDEWREFFQQMPVEQTLQSALLQTFRGITPGVVQSVLATLEWGKNIRIIEVPDGSIPAWAAAMED